MALKKLPYEKVALLLKDHLSIEESAETADLIRELRQIFRVSARDIERSLFLANQVYQTGTLYQPHGAQLSNKALREQPPRRINVE